jgi:hypothetical protein
MYYSNILQILANIAQSVTGIIAVTFWCSCKWEFRKKIRRLENHLKEEFHRYGGKRTILHIIAETGLTESEIIQASFKSRFIKRHKQLDDGKQTVKILFSYDPEGKSN